MAQSKDERWEEYSQRSARELAGMLVDLEDALDKAHEETAKALGLTKSEYATKRILGMVKRAEKKMKQERKGAS